MAPNLVTTLPASAQRFTEAARDLGLQIEPREFPEGTRTAEDAARAIGVEVGQIVKSLVFLASGAAILCLVSGANRLDKARLTKAAGGARITRADADAVRDTTGYAIGGVPPFAHVRNLTTYCDPDLLQYDIVWAAAGTPSTVFPIAPQKLVEITDARVVDLKESL